MTGRDAAAQTDSGEMNDRDVVYETREIDAGRSALGGSERLTALSHLLFL